MGPFQAPADALQRRALSADAHSVVESRDQEYAALVADRQACRACGEQLENGAETRGGEFDVPEVGAYADWQGRLDARLVVVAKDFASHDGFVGSKGRPDPTIQTNKNKNFVALFRAAGLPLSLPNGESEDAHFFTNAVLCMKSGGMSAPLRIAHIRACARLFLGRTLELVRPRVVVTLGREALLGLSEAFELGYDGEPLRELVGRFAQYDLPWGGKAIPAFHPSRLVGGRERNVEHWRRIADLLRDPG